MISVNGLACSTMQDGLTFGQFADKNMGERFVCEDADDGDQKQTCLKNFDDKSAESKHCANQSSQVKTITGKDGSLSKTITEKEEALNKLNECFKDVKSDFKTFDFKKFAEVNGITVDAGCIPHSDNVKNSFRRMYAVVDGLLNDGITLTINNENCKIISVKLTSEEIGNARIKANKNDEICSSGEDSVAYRLYVELYNIICDKLRDAFRKVLNAKNALCAKDAPNNTTNETKNESITDLLCRTKLHCDNIQRFLAEAGNDPQIGLIKSDVESISECVDMFDEMRKLGQSTENASKGSQLQFGNWLEENVAKLRKIIAGMMWLDEKEEDSKFFADLEAKLAFADKRFKEVKTKGSLITEGGEFVFGCVGKSDYLLLNGFLRLPFVNAANCLDLCRMFFELIESTYSYLTWFRLPQYSIDANCDATNGNKRNFFKGFQKLGTLADGISEDFKEKLLCAAKTLTEVGMSVPLCAIECEFDSPYDGLTNVFAGIALRNSQNLKRTFYHECVHNVRNSVGACVLPMSIDTIKQFKVFQLFNIDASIHGKSLDLILPKNKYKDLLDEITNVCGGDYALANCEEFLAEIGSKALSLLDYNKNPFDYIKDERLWRLYYEFGGPDFAPIIQQKGFLQAGYAECCNILSDKRCDWCSGYTSKFDIDVNQIEDQQVEVEGMTAIGQRSFVKIDEKTILPPPPLGYCYTTENGKLQLKIDKSIDVLKYSTDDRLYNPVFCSLTDGPLTLMKTEPQWIHHFEVLKVKEEK